MKNKGHFPGSKGIWSVKVTPSFVARIYLFTFTNVNLQLTIFTFGAHKIGCHFVLHGTYIDFNFLTIDQTSNTLRQLLPSAANYLNYTDVLHHPTNSCVATSDRLFHATSNGSRLHSRCFIRPGSLLDREFPHVNVLLTSFLIYRILRYES
jgi:hypothetical protein